MSVRPDVQNPPPTNAVGREAPPALVAELRSLNHEEQLLAAQRELLEARAENVSLRKTMLLRDLARQVGLTGRLRLDLPSGMVFPDGETEVKSG